MRCFNRKVVILVSIREAVRELAMVLWAWVVGEGDLFGLLIAWFQVVTGRVLVDDERQLERQQA